MIKYKELNIGDVSVDGKVVIVDADRLCYAVNYYVKDQWSIRTISKALVDEFVNYLRQHPEESNAEEIREKLKGSSNIDKFEYGYAATIFKLAQMVISKGAIDENESIAKQIIYYRVPETVSFDKKLLTAMRTKPFLLLAGISGTGKSRIVRELARACWDVGTPEYEAHKPKNFEMIQVKPNWHDSTELMGYVSRVSGTPTYIIGDFLRFITRAWENLEVPHFLCLDEMNLAPVEQYFAEFLSVIESRKSDGNGIVRTDPILKKSTEDWYRVLTAELTGDNEDLRNQFLAEGITIPQNLIVVGTVNMDETTFSFSRKVLDRAMTIEMNEVDLYAGLQNKYERIGKLTGDMLIGTAVEGVDVYLNNQDVCDKALTYLEAVNNVLNNTPFKVAYRVRNEFLLYVVNSLPYNKDDDGNDIPENMVIARALDEITNMKILSRIEGDDTKVKSTLLQGLMDTIEKQLLALTGEDKKIESVSIAKLKEMQERLESGYTSFWS